MTSVVRKNHQGKRQGTGSTPELSDVMCTVCHKPLEKARVEAIAGTTAADNPMHVACKQATNDDPKRKFDASWHRAMAPED